MRTEIFQKRTISVPNWVSVEINGIWQSQRKPSILYLISDRIQFDG